MARWGKLSTRGNVEDRRGMSATGIGGIGITGIALLLVVNYLSGGTVVDVLPQILNQVIETQNATPVDNPEMYEGDDDYELFVSTVLGSNNEFWRSIFIFEGKTYNPPTLVLFRNATRSACGGAVSRDGPHYCPLDATIYLDETFFDELQQRFGAEGGDVAQAYVIGHEVAHHVQNQLGIMDKARSNSEMNENENSVNLELQADCFSGMWANSLKGLDILEPDEIHEAIDAAAAVGDDRIQQRTQGHITPETWTHGSSQERVRWFQSGFENGTLDACNTFADQ